jgi:hypothetical protein
VQADPKTRILIKLALPRLRVVSDFRFYQTLETGPFRWGRVRVDNRLHNSFCAQEHGRPERQNMRRLATLGFVCCRDFTAAGLELCDVMLEDTRRNRDDAGQVGRARTRINVTARLERC